MSIIDSYISNLHSVYGRGTEAQAIGSWNGIGPFKIVNNYLEASTENVLFGGSVGSQATAIPSDIEFRHNYLTKPVAWRTSVIPAPATSSITGGVGGTLSGGTTYYYQIVATGTSGFEGGQTTISSGFNEVSVALTSTQNAVTLAWPGITYGDTLDSRHPTSYTIYRTSDAPGAATRVYSIYNFTPPDTTLASFSFQDLNAAPASTSTEAPTDSGPRQLGDVFLVKNLLELKNAQRVIVDGNVLEYCWANSQGGTAFVLTPRSAQGAFPGAISSDITFTNNLVRHVGGGFVISSYDDVCPANSTPPCATSGRYLIQNNLLYDMSQTWQVNGGNPYGIVPFAVNDLSLDHNTILTSGTFSAAQLVAATPIDNEFISHSILSGDLATTGPVPGPAGYFGVGNVDAQFRNNIASNLPDASSRQEWSAAAPSSFFPVDISGIGFVDYLSATPNLALAASSPYKNSGDDGRDIGADVASITSKTPEVIAGTGTASGNRPPVAGTVTPNTGTGTGTAFTFTFSDADGYQDLNTMNMLFGASSSAGINACWMEYNRANNQLRLFNDAASDYVSGATLSNSQCTVSLGAVTNANTTDLNIPVTVAFKNQGAANIYMQAFDNSHTTSGWQLRGSYTSNANATTLPDMKVTSYHFGSFTQGQNGAAYTLTAVNGGGGATTAAVTVTDALPTGLSATAISGAGWTCQALPALSCSRTDVLAAGASYPAITVTVNVAPNAPSSITNVAAVSGGGETNTANDSASDPTVVTQLSDLSVTSAHFGNFLQGQLGATYTVNVTNVGGFATIGGVNITDTLPPSLTVTAAAGPNWYCQPLPAVVCSRGDVLAPGASYSPLTVTVNVASNAPASVTNVVKVSGGGEVYIPNDTASDITTIVPTADLVVTSTHAGSFVAGQTGAGYQLTVMNSGGGATNAAVTVTDALPAGLTATAIGGTGWTCAALPALSCSRSDALAPAASYPPITLTVSIAFTAPASVSNAASVAGGGEANTSNDSATDPTVIAGAPDLTIASTHTGSFIAGQTGATYQLTASNVGPSATNAAVTVADTLPAGMTATAIGGTGWTCAALPALSCSRSDALAPGASYPAITLTVNVALNSASPVNNVATVSGGGEANTANDSSSDPTAVNPPSAASLTSNAGTPQSATVGAAFAATFQALAKDSVGNPVPNVTVTFTAPATGASGTFPGSAKATALTGATGVATSPVFTANGTAGAYNVAATAPGVTTALNFALTNTAVAGSAAQLQFTGQPPATGTAGSALGTVTVQIQDASGALVTGSTAAVTISAVPGGAGTGALTTSSTTTVNAVSGVATFTNLVLNTAGAYTLKAASSGLTGGVSSSFTISSGAASSISALAGSGQSAQVNTAFPLALQAKVVDSFGNPVTGATVTFAPPATGASGVFTGGNSAKTDSTGVATAPAFTANATAGAYTVTATVAGVTTGANFSLTNTAGSPGAISATQGATQSAVVNVAYGIALQANVVDGAANPVSGVTVTFTAPSTGASGTFATSGTATATAKTDVNGLAAAPAFTANTTSGQFTVAATTTGTSVPASFTLTNTAGPAATITATQGTPQSAQASAAFANLLQAKVVDSFGNPVTGATVTFTPPATGASATFTGGNPATAKTDSTGTATAPALTANTTIGSYSVSAAVPGATAAATFALTNTAGQPGAISAVQGATQSAVVNTAYPTILQAKVVDSTGNPVSGVTVTFTAPATGASGTFTGGATAKTDSSGTASAPIFTANTVAGAVAVTASAPGVSTSASFTLTNTAGPAATIAATQGTPQSAQASAAFANLLQAKVVDSFGNPVTGATVTFTPPATGASATFTGGNPATATTDTTGAATAPVLTANTTTGAYSVLATVPGATAAATFALTNTALPASNISALLGTPQSAKVNAAFSQLFQVKLTDSTGAAVPNASVTFTAPATGATGAFPTGAIATATTNSSGVATAPAFTANATAGAYTVVASSGALSVNFNLTNTAVPVSVGPALVTIAGTPQTAQLWHNFSTAMAVKLTDASGSPVTGAAVTFLAPTFGPGGLFTGGIGTLVVNTDSQGVATGSTFTATNSAGSYVVTAQANGLQTVFNLTNTLTAPGTLAASAGTPQSAPVNIAFAIALQATLTDGSGNPVSGAAVTFTAPASGPGGAFSGQNSVTVSTNASGIATATGFTANALTGTYVVSAAANGLSTTFSLTNTSTPTPTLIAQSGTPQSATVSTAFAQPLQAKLTDGSGNPVANATVVFTAPNTGASGTFAGGGATASVITNSLGIATSPTFTANATGGAYTITATNGSLTASFSLTNLSTAPMQLSAVGGNAQSAAVNTGFTQTMQAKLTDGSGNAIANATVVFTAPSSGAGGTFAGGGTTATVSTNVSGVASAPAFTANSTSGVYNVIASSNGVNASFTLTNNAVAPVSIVSGLNPVAGTPQARMTWQDFSPLTVQLTDAAGKAMPGVAVTFATPTFGPGGYFQGGVGLAVVNTDAQGLATAPTYTANGVLGSYSISASANGLSTAFQLANTANAPASLSAMAGTPQTAAVNTAFATLLQAKVLDSTGSPVSGAPVIFLAPSTGASGLFTGGQTTSTVLTDAQGLATAPKFTANGNGGTYAVLSKTTGFTATFNLTNTGGAGVPQLAPLGGTPQSAVVNSAFAQPLQAGLTDATGNPVASATVTFTAPSSGASGTFAGGATTATAATSTAGIAIAPAFTANGVAGSYVVTASNGTLSASFGLTNASPAPSQLTAVAGAPQSTPVNTAFPQALQAKFVDGTGNPIANASVVFTAPASGPSGTFAGSATATVTTDSQGMATAPAITANGAAGTYTVIASTGGLSVSFTLTNTPVASGSPTLAISAGDGQSATLWYDFATPLAVRLTDATGSPVASAPVTFLTPDFGTSGLFTGGIGTVVVYTNSQGIATAPTLTATNSTGTFAVTAQANNLAATFTLTNR